jgi:hypothetical protein
MPIKLNNLFKTNIKSQVNEKLLLEPEQLISCVTKARSVIKKSQQKVQSVLKPSGDAFGSKAIYNIYINVKQTEQVEPPVDDVQQTEQVEPPVDDIQQTEQVEPPVDDIQHFY